MCLQLERSTIVEDEMEMDLKLSIYFAEISQKYASYFKCIVLQLQELK